MAIHFLLSTGPKFNVVDSLGSVYYQRDQKVLCITGKPKETYHKFPSISYKSLIPDYYDVYVVYDIPFDDLFKRIVPMIQQASKTLYIVKRGEAENWMHSIKWTE